MISVQRVRISEMSIFIEQQIHHHIGPWTLVSLFHPHKKQIITPHQSPLAPVHYSHLSTGCLNNFVSVGPLCQSFSLIFFFCPCFIICSICGWVTNPRQISEPIYLLTLMHRDTLLPITFHCQEMSFWQDHLPA